MQLTAKQIEACEEFDRFVARIAGEVKRMAAERGYIADGEDERAGSRYIGVWTVDDDGCRDERVAAVRVSNHGQRYGGPDWSFETTDSDESIARGLAAIQKIIATF